MKMKNEGKNNKENKKKIFIKKKEGNWKISE